MVVGELVVGVEPIVGVGAGDAAVDVGAVDGVGVEVIVVVGAELIVGVGAGGAEVDGVGVALIVEGGGPGSEFAIVTNATKGEARVPLTGLDRTTRNCSASSRSESMAISTVRCCGSKLSVQKTKDHLKSSNWMKCWECSHANKVTARNIALQHSPVF